MIFMKKSIIMLLFSLLLLVFIQGCSSLRLSDDVEKPIWTLPTPDPWIDNI